MLKFNFLATQQLVFFECPLSMFYLIFYCIYCCVFLTNLSSCIQVRNYIALWGCVSVSRYCRGDFVLDRLLQFDAESVDLRLLQSRFPGGVQEYAAVCVPLLGQTKPIQCVLRVEEGRQSSHYKL